MGGRIEQALRLRYLARALFCRPLKTRAISSVVERLLHTQEVAGSNPASRTSSPAVQHLALDFIVERSPRRQVAGSNWASRTRFIVPKRGPKAHKQFYGSHSGSSRNS